MQIFKKIDRKKNRTFFIWKFGALFLWQTVHIVAYTAALAIESILFYKKKLNSIIIRTKFKHATKNLIGGVGCYQLPCHTVALALGNQLQFQKKVMQI